MMLTGIRQFVSDEWFKEDIKKEGKFPEISWKWKHKAPKPLLHVRNSPKMEMYCFKCLYKVSNRAQINESASKSGKSKIKN